MQIIYMLLKLLVGAVEIQTAKVLTDEPALPLTFVGTIFDLSKSQSATQQVHHQQQQQGQHPGGPFTITSASSSSRSQPLSSSSGGGKSGHMNESLPPYQSATAAMPRATTTAETPRKNSDIGIGAVTTPPSNVDDL